MATKQYADINGLTEFYDGIVQKISDDLASYYTKTQVDSLISAITTLDIEVVQTLPTQDISQTTIYLVPKSTAQTSNTYDEYINIDGTSAGWELIGSTAIDLSGYVQKSQTAGLLKNDGTVDTTIEGAVTANTSAISGIKDGQSIDSFSDVETALDGKISKSNTAGYVKNDGTIDTDLATTVANKVDKVEGKGLSTNDYTNTAKGIVDNIQDNVIANTKLIKDTVGWSGKNKLPNNAVSRELNGIVWEVYSDGHVRAVSGTATSDSNLTLSNITDFGNTHLTTYGTPTANGFTISDGRNDDSASTHFMAYDKNSHAVYIGIKSGQTVSNLDFYPMIRDANILDPTYEPYFGSTAFPRSEQAVLGAKNLLPLTLASLKASTSGGSWSNNVYTNGGVAYTISTDSAGYVTDISANGTADPSTDSYFNLTSSLNLYLSVGVDYILNGCPEDGGTNKYMLYTGSVGVWDDTGAGASKTYADTITRLFIKIKGGTTVTNKSFKPMIRLGSDPDHTFAPYAMTNEQLTEAVKTIPTVSVAYTGTASSTGVRKQQITVNNVDYNVDGSAYMEQSVTLSTSDVTTVTFTNAIIQTTSLIEYACSKWGIVPDDITASNGSCVITIPKQSNAETVSIRIYVR